MYDIYVVVVIAMVLLLLFVIWGFVCVVFYNHEIRERVKECIDMKDKTGGKDDER